MVLNLGSIALQGFGESVSGVRRQEILSDKTKIKKIHDSHFIFPITRSSMNACMELVRFSTSNNVKNHWYREKRAVTGSSPAHRFNPVKHIAAPPTEGCYLFSVIVRAVTGLIHK